MAFDGIRSIIFTSPDGTVVEDGSGSGPSSGSAEPLEAANARRGVTVTAGTVMPDHYGPLDLDLALTALIPPGQADPYRRR